MTDLEPPSADIELLSKAVVDRAMPVLQTLHPTWFVSWFKPEPVVDLPALCVVGDKPKFVDYHVGANGSYAKWHLRMGLYVPFTNQETGRSAMASLTAPGGPLIRRLEDELVDITDDDLWNLCRGDVKATTGKGWDTSKDTRSRFIYADIGLDLGAN